MRAQPPSWELEFRAGAHRALQSLGRQNPKMANRVIKKIQWLRENADVLRHEKLRGRDEYSLHVGQYRVLYELDWAHRRIVIARVGAHSIAYRD